MTASPSGGEAANGDSAAAFCRDLDAVFKASGVSLRQAAQRSGWGKTTIATARAGLSLPNKDLVRDVLQALRVSTDEVDAWMARHDRIAAGETAGDGAPLPADAPKPAVSRRRWLLIGTIGTALAIGVVAGLLIALLPNEPQAIDATAAEPPAGSKDIVVQNKVAIGPTTLKEDDTPSYLSSRTVSRCATNGCKLDGTEVYSGAKLTAYCQTKGEWLTNGDLGSEGIKQNAGLVASDLWYGIEWRDGRRGYISEVYIEPSYRDGLGLAAC